MINIPIKATGNLPVRAHPFDAGCDLFSVEDVSIYPYETKMIDTGLAVKIPEGYVGLVFNRSSQGKRRIIMPHSVGVIDPAYRGNIKVLLNNQSEAPYFITANETRISQLVIMPIVYPTFQLYQGTEEDWVDTLRGDGGFGSTGGT